MSPYTFWVAIMAAVSVGFILGVWLRPFLFHPTLPISDIRDFMAAAVNREEAELQRRQNMVKLQRSGRRSMRVDTGPSATVHRMRKRTNIIRTPIGRI